MKILYISEDYLSTKVHHNLCSNLVDNGIDITVYTVDRKCNCDFSINSTYSDINYKVLVYPFSGNNLRYKLDFKYKTGCKYNFLEKNLNLSEYDLILAATLFSEGFVAYKIYKNYNIPYIVVVRGTDVNFYLKSMFHLWQIGRKILESSQRIVCVTNTIKEKLEQKINLLKSKVDKSKISVIFNGIDDIWLNNIYKPTGNYRNNILYIGRFDSNKNVERLQQAIINLSFKKKEIHLTLVGGGGSKHDNVIKTCQKYPNLFTYLGKIYDKDKLMEIVRKQGAFAMISHSETFGLVYIEVLTQGLPVLYTKGQGIDGVFNERIGESVDSKNQKSIEQGIEKLLSNYEQYQMPSLESFYNFSWRNISNKYKTLFIEAKNN